MTTCDDCGDTITARPRRLIIESGDGGLEQFDLCGDCRDIWRDSLRHRKPRCTRLDRGVRVVLSGNG